MQINEIFSSVEGEGIRAGYLATFIRTHFCNLECKYCDTAYSLTAQKDILGNLPYRDMSIEEIMYEVWLLGNNRVTLTGGEPLIQLTALELIGALLNEGYETNIETNGSIPINEFMYHHNKDMTKLIITMDWKSPYSGMRDKMIEENLKYLRSLDVLKFVVATKEDLDDMKKTIESNDLYCNIFVSPVFGKIEGRDIVDYLKQNNLQNVRIQCQLHKIFWHPEQRGV